MWLFFSVVASTASTAYEKDASMQLIQASVNNYVMIVLKTINA